MVGKGLKTSGPCLFRMNQARSIRIGNQVNFIADHRSNRVGLSNPVILETWDDGEIEIGDFSGGSSVVVSSRSKVTIGRNVNMGGNVRIFDHDFHSLDYNQRQIPIIDQAQVVSQPVIIGNDVLLGTNATILKGVTIGNRAIIGAGSVVSKNIPADEIWAGNPARYIKGAARHEKN